MIRLHKELISFLTINSQWRASRSYLWPYRGRLLLLVHRVELS